MKGLIVGRGGGRLTDFTGKQDGSRISQVHPMKFFSLLKWLDGRPLVIEPYRKHIFSQALFSFNANGAPLYNLVLAGRAKKNWKTADLILAALYRLLAWQTGGGN